jgi:DNA topoisomerase-2
MAQDFVGSNNVNLLVPSGQFGTRLAGGKDAASPRYIFTALSPLARLLFPEVDDAVLSYMEDDGQLIEPKVFYPIVPLLLVNGAQGIGTGWSTNIPPHNPKDVLNYIRAKLDGKQQQLPPLRPWVRNFKGDIVAKDDGRGYDSIGKIEKATSSSVLISELPIGKWTNDYKDHLLRMRDKGMIQNIVEDHTTTSVSFTVGMRTAQLSRLASRSTLHKQFKLEAPLLLTNMHAFDSNGMIQRYDSAESIADAYFLTRLQLYGDRKCLLEASLNYSSAIVQNKANFIAAVSEGKVDIVRGQKSKAETIANLKRLGFASSSELDELKFAGSSNVHDGVVAGGEKDDSSSDSKGKSEREYDYLLNMPLSSLTTEKIHGLREDAQKTQRELEMIKGATPEDLWHSDLDKLEKYL